VSDTYEMPSAAVLGLLGHSGRVNEVRLFDTATATMGIDNVG
jgi:hypothetical protein